MATAPAERSKRKEKENNELSNSSSSESEIVFSSSCSEEIGGPDYLLNN